jgi:hypothetical protein
VNSGSSGAGIKVRIGIFGRATGAFFSGTGSGFFSSGTTYFFAAYIGFSLKTALRSIEGIAPSMSYISSNCVFGLGGSTGSGSSSTTTSSSSVSEDSNPKSPKSGRVSWSGSSISYTSS